MNLEKLNAIAGLAPLIRAMDPASELAAQASMLNAQSNAAMVDPNTQFIRAQAEAIPQATALQRDQFDFTSGQQEALLDPTIEHLNSESRLNRAGAMPGIMQEYRHVFDPASNPAIPTDVLMRARQAFLNQLLGIEMPEGPAVDPALLNILQQ